MNQTVPDENKTKPFDDGCQVLSVLLDSLDSRENKDRRVRTAVRVTAVSRALSA